MKFAVIGSGIAGSSLVRALRAAHADVVHVASPHYTPHSGAAAALLRSAYHSRHPGEANLFARSLELYEQWGVPLLRGGWTTNYRARREPRLDADWYLLDPAAPLLTPDVIGTAAPAQRGVTLDTGAHDVTADVVVWCTGAYLRPQPPGARVTHGITWVHPDRDALTDPERLRIHHYGPYKTIAAGYVGAAARLGSSSATTEAVAYRQADSMLEAALATGMIRSTRGWQAVHGLRVKTQDIGPEHLSGVHWRFGGLHRTGYALAPALAVDALAMFRVTSPV